jgi:hypothetical protein
MRGLPVLVMRGMLFVIVVVNGRSGGVVNGVEREGREKRD